MQPTSWTQQGWVHSATKTFRFVAQHYSNMLENWFYMILLTYNKPTSPCAVEGRLHGVVSNLDPSPTCLRFLPESVGSFSQRFFSVNPTLSKNGKNQGKTILFHTFPIIEMHQFPYSHYNSNIFEPWPAPIRSTTSSLQKGRQRQLHEWCWWQLLKILGPTNGDMIKWSNLTEMWWK